MLSVVSPRWEIVRAAVSWGYWKHVWVLCLLGLIGAVMGCSAPEPVLPLCEIQGKGFVSPYQGEVVVTEGVVYALKRDADPAGFFMEKENCDPHEQTSDGLFITLESFPDHLAVGDEVRVKGVVKEEHGQTVLEVLEGEYEVLTVGHALPEPVHLDRAFTRGGTYPRLENWEGMLVRLQRGIVAGPTNKEGVSWLLPGTLNAGKSIHTAATRAWPPLCLIDEGELLPQGYLKVGDQLNYITAVLEETRRGFCLRVVNEVDVEKAVTHLPSLPELPGFSLAYVRMPDMSRARDDHRLEGDPFPEDNGEGSLEKMARVIRDGLGEPALIALQGVVDESILEELTSVSGIQSQYDYLLVDGTRLEETPPALLYEAERVRIQKARLLQGCTSLQDGLGPDGNGSRDRPENETTCDRNGDGKLDGNRLFSQPPLGVELTFGDHEVPYLLVIVPSLETGEGDERARPRRLAQVQAIAELADGVDQSGVIVIGSLNGGPESSTMEALCNRGFHNLLAKVDVEARYTYLDGGISCVGDYVFVSQDLADEFRVLPIHINADYPVLFGTNPATVYRSSGHDPLLVYATRGGLVRGPRPPVTLIPPEYSPTLAPDPTGTPTPSATPTPYPAALLISEFMPNPAGEEPEGEWIEIYNPEKYSRLLTNYKLGDAESPADREGMLLFPPGYYIESGEVLVIAHHGETFYGTYGFYPDFEIENSLPRVQDMWPYYQWGSSRINLSNIGDEILLLDWEDRVVDSVSYGRSTWDGFQPPVPAPAQGHSLERYPPHRDRNRAKDWREKGNPSPGRLDLSTSTPTLTPTSTPTPTFTPSPTPTGPTPTPAPVHLLLSEVLADPAGVEPDGEWLELFNPASHPVPLGEVKIGDASHIGDPEGMMAFPAGASLQPGEVIVVANKASAFQERYGFLPDYECKSSHGGVPDLVKYASWATGSLRLRNGGDEVLILGPGDQVVDNLAYGDSGYGAFQPPAQKAGEGESLQRYPPGKDTGGASDWRVSENPSPGRLDLPTPTPQPTRTPTPTATSTPTWTPTSTSTTAPVRLLISEVLPNPDGPEPDGEWIEIFNPQGYVISLGQVKVGDASAPGDREGMFLFPESAVIQPGEVIIVANQGSFFASQYGRLPDFEFKDTLGQVPDMEKYTAWSTWSVELRNGGDEILILDRGDRVVDAVAYGNSSYGPFQPPVSKPSEGHSLERFPPSADHNTAEDWREQNQPSPGWLVWSTPTPSPTSSPAPTFTMTSTPSPTYTFTASPTPTSTPTPTSPATPTPTLSPTPSLTHNPTSSPTVTTTGTASPVPSRTPTPTPLPVVIILNEIHADPHPELGDANGDGIRHSDDDEFLEFVNVSGEVLDLSGWTIYDGVRRRHTFPSGTSLSEGCAVIIFGGGSPSGFFGGSLVQTTNSLGLNNRGDTVALYDREGNVRARYTYGSEANHDQSLTRCPDIFGPFVKHGEVVEDVLFSPGVKSDGTSFGSCP